MEAEGDGAGSMFLKGAISHMTTYEATNKLIIVKKQFFIIICSVISSYRSSGPKSLP